MAVDFSKYTKAIVGAVIASGAQYQSALAPESPAGAGVTSAEWIQIGVTFFITIIAVWAVPNMPSGPPAATVGRHRATSDTTVKETS